MLTRSTLRTRLREVIRRDHAEFDTLCAECADRLCTGSSMIPPMSAFRTSTGPLPTLSEQIAAMEAEIEEIKQSPAEWRPRSAPTG